MNEFSNKGFIHGKHKGGNPLDIQAFVDSDWASSTNDRKFTSSYCSKLGGNLVIRKSKKQNVVAKSSVEAEYRSMA